MQGWLEKEGGSGVLSRWQWRWFAIRESSLCYYKDESDTETQGCIAISDIRSVSRIEHSGRAHCLSLVGEKKGGKTYYLAAQTDFQRDQWYEAILPHVEGEAYVRTKEICKFATAEVFVDRGIRVSGDVGFSILKQITEFQSNGHVSKMRDDKGWYCDKQVSLSYVLNLFASQGWTTERLYPSETTLSIGSLEDEVYQVIKVVFCTRKTVCVGPRGRLPSLTGSLSASREQRGRSGSDSTTSSGTGSYRIGPVGSVSSQDSGTVSDMWIDGTDEELLQLMREFNIPTSLLEKDGVTQKLEVMGYH